MKKNKTLFFVFAICTFAIISCKPGEKANAESTITKIKEMEECIVLAHTEASKLEKGDFLSNPNIHDIFTSETIFEQVRSQTQYGEKLDSITYIEHNWFKVSYDLSGYYFDSGENEDYDVLLYLKIKNEDNKFKLDDIAYAYSQCTLNIKDLPCVERIKFWFKTFKYDEVQPYFQGNLCKVRNDDKYGFINIEGMEIIPCKYEDVAFLRGDILEIDKEYIYDDYKDSLLCVKTDNKYGLINLEGKEIIPCKYDNLTLFYGGWLFKTESANKYGLVDSYGKERIPCEYDDFTLFQNRLIKAKTDNKYGLFEFDGKEIVPCKYDNLALLDSDCDYLVKAESDNKYGLIEFEMASDYELPTIVKGKEILPCSFDHIESVDWGMLKVQRDNLWSYYKKDGTQVTDFYENIIYYHDKMDYPIYAAKSNGKWGYINKDGDMIISFILDYAGEPYKDGTAYASYNGYDGKVNLHTQSFTIIYNNIASNPTVATTICPVCNGTGKMAYRGGGIVIGTQQCAACGGLGTVSKIMR